ncbi:DUF368 domain-containing protein [Bacillus sp. SM2101]|uniref:undecaprenyl phosphate translocase family protein n=1 Tax=Bacillus sp. SM2101 TaxID=2805366 RepID=UPI001BDE4693|nr:DUF368 domain-containing protein [Bacillus sp. SM2101]
MDIVRISLKFFKPTENRLLFESLTTQSTMILFLAGALANVALLLPGISGSLFVFYPGITLTITISY